MYIREKRPLILPLMDLTAQKTISPGPTRSIKTTLKLLVARKLAFDGMNPTTLHMLGNWHTDAGPPTVSIDVVLILSIIEEVLARESVLENVHWTMCLVIQDRRRFLRSYAIRPGCEISQGSRNRLIGQEVNWIL